jgi:hypothetical protein
MKLKRLPRKLLPMPSSRKIKFTLKIVHARQLVFTLNKINLNTRKHLSFSSIKNRQNMSEINFGGAAFDIEITVLLIRVLFVRGAKKDFGVVKRANLFPVALGEARPFALHNSLLRRDKSQLNLYCFLLQLIHKRWRTCWPRSTCRSSRAIITHKSPMDFILETSYRYIKSSEQSHFYEISSLFHSVLLFRP